MTVKVEMYFDIEDADYEKVKKLEHHVDWLLDLDNYPEIESVYDVSVIEVTY